MTEKKKNLSEYDLDKIPDASHYNFGILVSEWNHEVTASLGQAAIDTLMKHGTPREQIVVRHVPGSFELPVAAKLLAKGFDLDAIICIGCVIQGETRHFEFISNAVANGITEVGVQTEIPVIFGVLTTDTMEQAKERAGGKHGNKGDEAAISAIKMADLRDECHDFDIDLLDELPFDEDDEEDDEDNFENLN